MKRNLAAVGSLFARLARDESGSAAAERALVTGLVCTATYASAQAVGEKVRVLWQTLDTALSATVR